MPEDKIALITQELGRLLDRKWPKIAQNVDIVPVAVQTWLKLYLEGEIVELVCYLALKQAKGHRSRRLIDSGFFEKIRDLFLIT